MELCTLISQLSVDFRILLEIAIVWMGWSSLNQLWGGEVIQGTRGVSLSIRVSENSLIGRSILALPLGTVTLLKLLTLHFSYWFQKDNNAMSPLLKIIPKKKKKKSSVLVQTPKPIILKDSLFPSPPQQPCVFFPSMPFPKPLTFHCVSSLPAPQIMPDLSVLICLKTCICQQKPFHFLYVDTKISHIDFCVALISCKLSKQWQVGTRDNECSIRLIQINGIGEFQMRCRGCGLDSRICQNKTDGQKLTLLPLYLDGLISRFLSFGSHLSFLALNGTP